MHDPWKPGTPGHYLVEVLSTLFGTHMRLRDVLLHQPDSLQESPPLVLPWHEPPFLNPTTSDVMDTPPDQCTPEEVLAYLKSRNCPTQHQGKKTRELR